MEHHPRRGKPAIEPQRDLEMYVLSVIRKENPSWIEADGSCPACIEFYNELEHAVEVLPPSS